LAEDGRLIAGRAVIDVGEMLVFVPCFEWRKDRGEEEAAKEERAEKGGNGGIGYSAGFLAGW
jgi:hypothetical protein